ncbi:hypothetical protein NGB36_21695 [Streptomyces sp. RB6PN25]|uniref:Transposase n=1 Tax=Streptomyces humicola TaxID=2953240 RepID=A0ABT1PZP8_9ACTN|nr:hypothetical protein [Streptomyces humicola]MCQ4083148.1 hypothetical protein [Streptomyces humicola]
MGAVCDVLGPYAWRSLTPVKVSRLALAALDGQPVARQDERIGVLVGFLDGCRWRSLTVGALSRRLVSALDAWRRESQWLEIELRLLLDAERY